MWLLHAKSQRAEISSTQEADVDRVIQIARMLDVQNIRVYSRYEGTLSQVMAQTVVDLKYMAEQADRYNLFFDFEQHEEFKSTEIVQMLKEVDHPRINALFDFTNMINAYEQPLPALRIMAPYTRQVHLKGAKKSKEDKGYGQMAVVQGSPEDEMPYARRLYELLMLGGTKPQVICFALEQEVNYYAPAYRHADEGENPFIPYKDPSETPFDVANADRLLLNERRWASNQVNFIKSLLAKMRWLATSYLENQKQRMMMQNKVVLVLSDALRYDVAVAQMGFLGHMLETKLASLYKVIGELPSMSRPMYETVHTGLPVIEHGVVSNQVVRRSKMPNIFQAAKEAGKTTAAVANFWFSELYNRAPYDPLDDREVDDDSLLIQHGRFYYDDAIPDTEVFVIAGMLVRKFNPDYLLVHPMGMDDIGHKYGADTSEYRSNAIRQDVLLANLIPEWIERGYNILVTGDHGMNADGMHGGATPDAREVPLYLIRPGVPGEGDTGDVLSQLQIAPTVCKLLGIPIPGTMKQEPVISSQ